VGRGFRRLGGLDRGAVTTDQGKRRVRAGEASSDGPALAVEIRW
jgi:hypothetical protein